MRVVTVPVLGDNYAYLVIDKHGDALLVDPAEPDKALWAASQQRARLQAVLTTHGHKDHAGGNKRLAQHLPELEIVGGAGEGVPAATREVADGEALEVGDLRISCLATPYHTAGHMCYLIQEEGCQGPAAAFTGDVLFVGGCGRRFQGTPEQMYHTLMRKLATLPPDTLVYCGHEYTVGNLEFSAATVDGSNPAVLEKLEWAKQQRAQGLPTVPSTIGEELRHNVFLRCHEPAIQRQCGTAPDDGAVSDRGAAEAAVQQQQGQQQQGGGGGGSDGAGSAPGGNERRNGGAKEQEGAEVTATQTLAELRRLKDNYGLPARLVTTALTVAGWLGWTP